MCSYIYNLRSLVSRQTRLYDLMTDTQARDCIYDPWLTCMHSTEN